MSSLFGLPDEAILTPIFESYPCREHQTRSLATLLHVCLLTINLIKQDESLLILFTAQRSSLPKPCRSWCGSNWKIRHYFPTRLRPSYKCQQRYLLRWTTSRSGQFSTMHHGATSIREFSWTSGRSAAVGRSAATMRDISAADG
jgi:hypothetical protein